MTCGGTGSPGDCQCSLCNPPRQVWALPRRTAYVVYHEPTPGVRLYARKQGEPTPHLHLAQAYARPSEAASRASYLYRRGQDGRYSYRKKATIPAGHKWGVIAVTYAVTAVEVIE